MSLFESDRSAERLPVTVLTGFLGSGKTTLLNGLLREPAFGDTAVIVNELGEIALDHLLVEAIEGETVVMASGCICCSIRSDLEETLSDLYRRRRQGAVPAFARLVIETTGLADPAPILQMLLNRPRLCTLYRLDGVIATVDAVNGERQLDVQFEAVKQAALADRLVVTKTDLAVPEVTEALEARLRAINPSAPLLRAADMAFQPARLFGAGWSNGETRLQDWLGPLTTIAHNTNDHHHHDSSIAAFPLVIDEPLDWQSFSLWMAWLRGTHGDHLLRVKGLLNIVGEPGPVVVHGVHHVFHSPVSLPVWPDADRRSRLVFITRDLPMADVAGAWREFAEAV